MKTSTKTDFSDQYIYIGIDVHLKQWQVSIFTDYGEFKTFSQPGEAAVLISYLRRTFAGAHLCCAYEAGFSGFWLQQELERHGIEAIVVHPPDVPTSDKERRFKRNKSDARKLARELRSGKLKAIYVPTVAQLSDRALVRNRDRLMRKQTRVKNQIKGHLYFFGIALPESRRYWSRAFLRWLEQCAAEPSPLLPPMAAMWPSPVSVEKEKSTILSEKEVTLCKYEKTILKSSNEKPLAWLRRTALHRPHVISAYM